MKGELKTLVRIEGQTWTSALVVDAVEGDATRVHVQVAHVVVDLTRHEVLELTDALSTWLGATVQ